jgi:ParB family transcriptional regulator, chromosome partitioning protein
MNKLQTHTQSTSSSVDQHQKPRRLGRGLSALLGEPIAIQAPAVPAVTTSPTESSPQAAHSGSPVSEPKPTSSGASLQGTAKSDPVGEASGTRIVQIPLHLAEPNRFQPRRTFDEAQLTELAASIRSAGVVQPILVRPGAAGKYEIVAGERRWRACKIAGLTHVPAVLAVLSDEQAAEWALIENIQRADLSAMERAWAVRGLAERFGLSHAQIGDRLGIDRSSAANLSRLTELEQEIHELLDLGQISAGHGKVLVGMTPGPVRVGLAKQAANQGWSVRRLEQAAARAAQSPTGAAPEVKIGESAIAKATAMKEFVLR